MLRHQVFWPRQSEQPCSHGSSDRAEPFGPPAQRADTLLPVISRHHATGRGLNPTILVSIHSEIVESYADLPGHDPEPHV